MTGKEIGPEAENDQTFVRISKFHLSSFTLASVGKCFAIPPKLLFSFKFCRLRLIGVNCTILFYKYKS